jgi:hypothetical protein
MAEEAQFLKRTGTVVHMQEPRTLGADPKFQKQVGGFTIEQQREYKTKDGQTKVAHDYITFDCEGNIMSQLPNVGDKVSVEFTIGGTYWKKGERYFNKLRAFKIETLEFAPRQSQQQPTFTPRREDVQFLDNNQPLDASNLPF